MSRKHVFGAALLLALSNLAFSQIRSATINGSVKDGTGAVVIGAAVAIVNQETNITANISTTDSGQFVFPYLPAGTYTVTVTAPGFVVFKETGLKLETAQSSRVDVTLKVSN